MHQGLRPAPRARSSWSSYDRIPVIGTSSSTRCSEVARPQDTSHPATFFAEIWQSTLSLAQTLCIPERCVWWEREIGRSSPAGKESIFFLSRLADNCFAQRLMKDS